jgi:peptidyl-prolyl cis-trans isomerase C
MSRMTKTITAVSAVVLLSAAVTFAVHAQDSAPAPAPDAAAPAADTAAPPEPPRDPTTVVAKAGSAEITEGDIALAQEAFASELANVPKEQQRSVLVDAIVNMQLMAQGAQAAGLDKGPEFDRRLQFLRLQALRNVFVQHEVVKNVPDSELQQAYQTLVVAQHKPEQQVHARHILVDTKEAAEKIIADLKGGVKGSEWPERRRPRLLRSGTDGAAVREGGVRAGARPVHAGACAE